MRVLLVEDNAEICDFLCLSLNEASIQMVAGVPHLMEEGNFDGLVIDSFWSTAALT